MAPATVPPASLAEHVCLALVVQEPQHGWALVRALAPDGDLGRVWSLSRPLTYRAIDSLLQRRWVARAGSEPGAGPRRQLLRATARGRSESERWLAAPVEHVRDVRVELLLKLALHTRSGRDARALLRAQRRELMPVLRALDRAAHSPDADAVDLWRFQSSQAVERFLDAALSGEARLRRVTSSS